MKKFRKIATSVLLNLLLLVVYGLIPAYSQSTTVDYPTPITSDTINGKIKARDIGDSRLTVHYYVFEGTQGDIFLKVESTNLNGDIDVFYAENLRPLTKISLYADSVSTQTGREIYLRKPEKLILRVEGRTPNDEPGLYSIKFEGSFQAVAANSVEEEPKLPEIKNDSEGETKVNSVGTIIESEPKPKPTPKETVVRNTRRRGIKTTTTPQAVSTVKSKSSNTKKETPQVEETPEKKSEVVVTDSLPEPTEAEKTEAEKAENTAKTAVKPKTTKKKTTTSSRKTTAKKAIEPKTPKPDPATELAKGLENVRLIVEFKDGARIERPMNEVLRFGVDKGVLTIIHKDGTVGRYSILEVAKITVE